MFNADQIVFSPADTSKHLLLPAIERLFAARPHFKPEGPVRLATSRETAVYGQTSSLPRCAVSKQAYIATSRTSEPDAIRSRISPCTPLRRPSRRSQHRDVSNNASRAIELLRLGAGSGRT